MITFNSSKGMRLVLLYLLAVAPAIFASPYLSTPSTLALRNHPGVLLFQDGFPNATDAQTEAIEINAHGVLPQGSPGATISPEGITAFQIFQFASTVSAAFYDQLLTNVTSSTSNFDLPSGVDNATFIRFLEQAKAVEELHALSSIHALGHFNASALPVCSSYDFPITSFDAALRFGIVLQSNLIGAIGDLAVTWAGDQAYGLVSIISGASAVIGQQLGFLRSTLGLSPIQSPFSTPSTAAFTYSYLLSSVDTATCPKITSLPLQRYPSLEIVNASSVNIQTTSIHIKLDKAPWDASSNYSVVYLNEASSPVAEPAKYISEDDVSVLVEAAFPYTESLLDGVTLVLVTNATLGKYAPVQNATSNAIWAPGFVLVN